MIFLPDLLAPPAKKLRRKTVESSTAWCKIWRCIQLGVEIVSNKIQDHTFRVGVLIPSDHMSLESLNIFLKDEESDVIERKLARRQAASLFGVLTRTYTSRDIIHITCTYTYKKQNTPSHYQNTPSHHGRSRRWSPHPRALLPKWTRRGPWRGDDDRLSLGHRGSWFLE